MSGSSLSATLQAEARHRCGYCHADERLTGMALSTEHLLPPPEDAVLTDPSGWRGTSQAGKVLSWGQDRSRA